MLARISKTILIIFLLLSLVPDSLIAQDDTSAVLWELYQKGRYAEVIALSQSRLDDGETSPGVYLAMGRSLVDTQEYERSLPFLQSAVDGDTAETWIYAWGQVYLGNASYLLGDQGQARESWILARDCGATRNATGTAHQSLLLLGLAEVYEGWSEMETEHFDFRFSNRLSELDRAAYAERREAAYAKISDWFEGGPAKKIMYFIWADSEESIAAGVGPLGFARPHLHVIHSAANQTVGHEMTHIISYHARTPLQSNGLINEGTAVCFDQTGRDQLERARAIMADQENVLRVAVKAAWVDWTLMPEEHSYPVAGAFVSMLVDRGGREKFLEFFGDQSLAHAQAVYGDDLEQWITDFERKLYD
jgi:tetratricopeptide (TPR) repeat protein